MDKIARPNIADISTWKPTGQPRIDFTSKVHREDLKGKLKREGVSLLTPDQKRAALLWLLIDEQTTGEDLDAMIGAAVGIRRGRETTEKY
jgi:hypothetical protein